MNVIQTLLYQHQLAEVLIHTIQERVEVEIGLCGFTKLSGSLIDFLILFVTSLYFSKSTNISVTVSH